MTMTLQEFRDSTREHLGVGDEYTDPQVDALLNRAWREVQAKFKFRETEDQYEFDTAAHLKTYTLPTNLKAIQAVSLIVDDETHRQLLPLPLDQSIHNSSENADDETEPTHYLRRKDQLLLYQTPDAVYTIRVYFQAILADFISSGIPIPQEWDEIILYGAVSRGHAELRNMKLSAAFSQMAAAAIASCVPVEVKEIEDSRYAQVQVLRPQYRRKR